jgi:hypothetical protein
METRFHAKNHRRRSTHAKIRFYLCRFRHVAATVITGAAIGVSADAQTVFSYSGTIQTWTVPVSGIYDITAYGAEGGQTYAIFPGGSIYIPGGLGTEIGGDVSLVAGQTLNIVVGGEGQGAAQVPPSGGGGGSFVYVPGASQPLVVAGGGGGGAGLGAPVPPTPPGTAYGQTGTSGADGVYGAAGGTGGNGGGGSATGGGGGGGWSSNGGLGDNGSGGGSGPTSFAGGIGALNATGYPGNGGFGGGGAGGYFGGGGGGGYSGGGGGGDGDGGAGGSYLDPSATELIDTVEPFIGGNGEVTVDLVSSLPDGSVPLAYIVVLFAGLVAGHNVNTGRSRLRRLSVGID